MQDSTKDKPFQNGQPPNGGAPSRVVNPLMIGSSALGDQLLERFRREGWEKWRVVDSDDLLFHNISKHELPRVSHGLRLTGSMKHFNKFEPAEGSDGLGKKSTRGKYGRQADLIVDVSGAFWVRWMLSSKNLARCASMFMTPPGDDSVLLLEDWRRSLRLDRLEPQYYRWLIHRDTGGKKDGGRMADGEGGEGRAAPARAVAPHAEALPRRFATLVETPDPAIIACRGGAGAGRPVIHAVTPHASLEQNICGWRIIWDKGVERKVLEMRWNEIPRETGGVILGYVDGAAKFIFVVDVCSAPGDSTRVDSTFFRGDRGVAEAVKTARLRTGKVVNYVGEWRSHPDAMFPIPGMGDLDELARARDDMAPSGHPPIILIIGENDLMFHVMMDR
ncbi:MAG: hypothetical protein GY859_40535 [Desulfobacterales bacterium]|nr:hypothetical protein [Desulfobacterales bacterium]